MRGTIVKKGKRYYVATHHRDENGKRKQSWHGGYATKREAQQALTDVLSRLDRGSYVEPSKITLEKYLLENWLPSIKARVRPSTWDSYQRNVRMHVIPTLGSLPLQRLAPGQLNRLYAQLLADGRRDGRGGLSAKTVHYVHTIVHTALRDAASENLIAINVAERARPPKQHGPKAREMQVWTAEQLRAFLGAVREDRLYAAWALTASTGMRRGEVLGLRWCDVDLEAGQASVCQTVTSVAYDIQLSSTKTSQGTRTVALDPATAAILRGHRKRQAAEQLAWGPDYEQHGLVFTREDGSPIHPDRFTQMFNRHVRVAGLPRIRLHDLRHTHATLMLQAGVPIKVVSERLGHSSPAFTMSRYQHVIPGMQTAAADAIGALLFGDGHSK